MPGQTGSETRQRTVVRSTRWSETEFAQLQSIAVASGCSEAEVLRRLVARADKHILITRDLVVAVSRLGSNLNQIARHLNRGGLVDPDELLVAYTELLSLITLARS
ncbi:MAG: plasmid mobilization relaxosome protein MobC [Sphingomonadaceae bacterium]